MASVLADLR